MSDLRKAAAEYQAHVAAGASPLDIGVNVATTILKDAEKAAGMVEDARKLLRANRRPLAFLASAMQDATDAKLRATLLGYHLNPDDPEGFVKHLRVILAKLKQAKAAEQDRAIWDQHYKSQQRGPY